MCVAITLAANSYLDIEEVIKMNRANADGVGIAWAKNGVVQWFKTTEVKPDFITEAIKYWSAYPRLVHFRFATAGGRRPDLCHPFEVGPLANCRVTGKSSKVMIHNGHWSRWSEVHDLLKKEDLLPDKGPWSDTRLAAYLAHEDPEWLEALGGRVAIMTGDGETTRLGDWQQFREGMFVSNKSWDNTFNYTRGGYAGYREWQGWGEDWDEGSWEELEKQKLAAKKAEEAEIQKELDDLEKDEAKKAKQEAREKAKKEWHEKRASGAERRRRRITEPLTQPLVKAQSDDTNGVKLSREDKRRQYSEEPWHNKTNGKWYQWKAGYVVEVAPPDSKGTAC